VLALVAVYSIKVVRGISTSRLLTEYVTPEFVLLLINFVHDDH
jgi:hypothetical protein